MMAEMFLSTKNCEFHSGVSGHAILRRDSLTCCWVRCQFQTSELRKKFDESILIKMTTEFSQSTGLCFTQVQLNEKFLWMRKKWNIMKNILENKQLTGC